MKKKGSNQGIEEKQWQQENKETVREQEEKKREGNIQLDGIG